MSNWYADVERRGRLVEQQDLGLLREGARDHDALLLAAGERGEAPAFQRGGARRGEGLPRERHVARPFELERAEMRVAAHEGDLEHRVVEREVRFLRHDRNRARQHGRAGSTPGSRLRA